MNTNLTDMLNNAPEPIRKMFADTMAQIIAESSPDDVNLDDLVSFEDERMAELCQKCLGLRVEAAMLTQAAARHHIETGKHGSPMEGLAATITATEADLAVLDRLAELVRERREESAAFLDRLRELQKRGDVVERLRKIVAAN